MNSSEQTSQDASEVPRIVFFDANFVGHLLRGDFAGQLGDPASDLCSALQLPFKTWRSAFSFMEWIGLNPKRLPKPSEFPLASVTDQNFIEPTYEHFQKHFGTLPELQTESLAALEAKQREYVAENLRPIWDSMMSRLFEDGDVANRLQFALCFDAVHKITPDPELRRDFHSDLAAAAFFGIDSKIRNLSKYRLAYRMWIRTRDKLSGPDTSEEQKNCIAATHELVKVGNWEDYLDGDLVHVATYGAEESDENRHRVLCLTCDNPEVVTMRIRLYKGLLSYVRKLYREKADAEGCPTNYESSHNGEVHCFDSQGNLVRRIDVATETPALAFLGKEPS